jgi:hypothetical protein
MITAQMLFMHSDTEFKATDAWGPFPDAKPFMLMTYTA